MTIEEAFLYSEQNQAPITHRFFSDNEYIIVRGNQITTEEGYSINKHEFMSYRTSDSWKQDWKLYNQ